MAVMIGHWQKILIKAIQVNLCCLIPASLGNSTKLKPISLVLFIYLFIYYDLQLKG